MKLTNYKLIFIFCFLIPTISFSKNYNVIDFGAKADGKTVDTKAIQAAIDSASFSGGGTVIIPSGKVVLTGSFYMKDFVTLRVENGGVLKGS